MVTLCQLPSPLTQIPQSFAGDPLYCNPVYFLDLHVYELLKSGRSKELSVLAEILADTSIIST